MNRGDLSNEQWETLKPLLPPLKPRTGKSNRDHRQVVNGILWIRANRSPLARPNRTLWFMGKCGHKVLSVAKSQYLAASLRTSASLGRSRRKLRLGGSLRQWHRNSRTPTRGGWKKGGEVEEKLGRSRGGFSTKIHIRCEGKGKPITFLLTPGQRNESIFLEQLMEQGAVKRSGRGRPRIRPSRVVGDKGYTGRRIRSYLRRRGIRFTIPRLSNEPRRGPKSP